MVEKQLMAIQIDFEGAWRCLVLGGGGGATNLLNCLSAINQFNFLLVTSQGPLERPAKAPKVREKQKSTSTEKTEEPKAHQ